MEKKVAVYETDVQFDFARRTGALFVYGNKFWSNIAYGAEARLPNIFALHEYASKNGWRILGSVDRHFYEDAELIRNKGGVFQDHCMNGTRGQLREAELEPQKDVYILRKEGPMMGVRVYTEAELTRFVENGHQLIFEKQSYDVDTNPNFKETMRLLFAKGLNAVVFNGFATDYCVKAAVLATAKYRDEFAKDVKLYVVTDAIEEVDVNFKGEVDDEFGNKALDEMVNAGAEKITTKDVLERRI